MTKLLLVLVIFFTTSLTAAQIQWEKDFQTGVANATKQKKPILFIYSSHTCKYCVMLENETLNNKDVVETLNKEYISIISYSDEGDFVPKELWRPGTPTIWFLDPQGRAIIKDPIMGAIDAQNFIKVLDVITREFDNVMESRK